MKRKIHFLCPECTFERSFDVETSECHNDKMNLSEIRNYGIFVGFQLACPKCGTYMYQADKELIKALRILHQNKLCPVFHCDRFHDELQLFDFRETTRHLNGEEFCAGPYIALRDLTKQEIFELGIVVGKMNSELRDFQIVVDQSKSLTRNIRGNKKKFSKTQINVYSKKSDPLEIQLASRFLTQLIEDWVERLNMYERYDTGMKSDAIPSFTPFFEVQY